MLKAITLQNHMTMVTSNLPNQPLMPRVLMSLTCPLNLTQPEGMGVDIAMVMGKAVIMMVAMLIAITAHWMPMMTMLCLRCLLDLTQPDIEIRDVDVAMAMHTKCQKITSSGCCPSTRFSIDAPCGTKALCGKEMPQILVDIVYRVSSDSYLASPMLLIITRWRKHFHLHYTSHDCLVVIKPTVNPDVGTGNKSWSGEQLMILMKRLSMGYVCLLGCTDPTMSQLHHSVLKRKAGPSLVPRCLDQI